MRLVLWAYAVIGSLATLIGAGRKLAFAAAYATISSAVVLAVPAIWSVRWQDPAAPRSAGLALAAASGQSASRP